MHVTRANAELQHHGCVRRFGEREALLDGLNDRREVGTRVEQPHLRLHREGVRSLLHDAGAVAIIFADDDERAAFHAARGEIGEGIRGDVGADGRLERHRTTKRIVHGGRQRGGRGRLGRAMLEMNAKRFQDRIGIRQHVHEV